MSAVELESSMVYFTPDKVIIVLTVGDLTNIDDTLRFNCCNAIFFYKACNLIYVFHSSARNEPHQPKLCRNHR